MPEDKYLPLADYSIDCSRGRHDFRDEYSVENLSVIKEDLSLPSMPTLLQLGEVKCGFCHRILRVYAYADILKKPQGLPAPFLMNWHRLTQKVLDRFNSLSEPRKV